MRDVIALILGGGRGTRLYPLTKYRAKPAVPLAGKYRLIDIPISNCLNSGIKRVYVLTQFLSTSLHRHIRETYRFDAFGGGFVELLAAQQTMEEGRDWYQGTADAVRKNLQYVRQAGVRYVLILSGDQLYRMDYRRLVHTHEKCQAHVTIAALPVHREQARSLGVMRMDETGRVVGFLEKPQTDAEVELVRTDPAWIDARGIASRGRDCVASMGIYLFDCEFLVEALEKTGYQDFGKEVFPAAFRSRRVHAHLFDDYWEDIGTIRAFYEANLSLVGAAPPFSLNAPDGPVYTRARFLPPTMIEGATVRRSMIADGCRIGAGAVIENSIIGLRSVIGEGVTIRDSIVMGSDFYDSPATAGGVPLGIGAGSQIQGAILDKNCRIGRHVCIRNEHGTQDSHDAPDCVIREGLPVVLKDATLPDAWKLEG